MLLKRLYTLEKVTHYPGYFVKECFLKFFTNRYTITTSTV